jgi:hypothetical protein
MRKGLIVLSSGSLVGWRQSGFSFSFDLSFICLLMGLFAGSIKYKVLGLFTYVRSGRLVVLSSGSLVG